MTTNQLNVYCYLKLIFFLACSITKEELSSFIIMGYDDSIIVPEYNFYLLSGTF